MIGSTGQPAQGARAKPKRWVPWPNGRNGTTAQPQHHHHFGILLLHGGHTHTHTVARTMSRWSAVALIARRSNVEGLPGIPREGAVSTPLKGEAGRSKKYTNRNHDPLRSNERGYSSSSNSHWHFALVLATSTRSGSFKKAHALNALGHRPSTKRDGRAGEDKGCMVHGFCHRCRFYVARRVQLRVLFFFLWGSASATAAPQTVSI